jgi:putative SOS response-associated peptidase YedK
VPIEAFYEWKKLGPKEKQPYATALADRRIMALGGYGRRGIQETRDCPRTAGQERR